MFIKILAFAFFNHDLTPMPVQISNFHTPSLVQYILDYTNLDYPNLDYPNKILSKVFCLTEQLLDYPNSRSGYV